MRLILCFFALCILTGCATSPIPAERAKRVPSDRLLAYQNKPDEAYGTVIVTRDTGVTGAGCKMYVYIDGTHAASLWSGETARFYLPVGNRIIGVNTPMYCGGGLKEHQQLVGAKQNHRLRISTDTSFVIDIAPTAF